MIKLNDLDDRAIDEISHHVADAFFDYEYKDGDLGLKKYITTREDMFTYINAIVKAECCMQPLTNMKVTCL